MASETEKTIWIWDDMSDYEKDVPQENIQEDGFERA